MQSKKMSNWMKNHLAPFVKNKESKRINVLRFFGVTAFLIFVTAHIIKLFLIHSFSDAYMATITGLFSVIVGMNVWSSSNKRKYKK